MSVRKLGSVLVCAAASLASLTSPAAPKRAAEPTAGTQCSFARSRRSAELTTRSGHHVELFGSQIAIDGRFDTACTVLPDAHPLAIARWDDGFVVAFRDAPLEFWDSGRYRPLAGAPKAHARALASDAEHLYVGTDRGLFSLDHAGNHVPVAESRLGNRGITALYVKPDRSLLVGTDSEGLWIVPKDGQPENLQKKAVVGCIRGRGGSVSILPPGPKCLDPATAGTLPAQHVTALAAYRGALAVGSFDGGVFLIGAKGETKSVEGAPRNVNALLAAGERLYIGAANGLFAVEKGRAQRVSLGAPEPHVNDLVLARDGALWLATNRGLLRWMDGAARAFSTERGLPSPLVYAVAEAADGAIWAGTARGLVRLTGHAAETFGTANGKLPHDWVTALLPDGTGVLVGTYNAGVVRLSARGESAPVEAFAKAWVNPHALARVGGALVVGTEGNGALGLGAPLHVPSSDVTALLELDGSLWIGTRAGLMRRSP